MRVRVIAFLALAALACSVASEGPSNLESEALVVAEEKRYRIVAHAVSPVSDHSPGELRVKMVASGGWHLEPEAPIRLDFEPSDVRLEPTSFANEDAHVLNDDSFEFVAQLHADASGDRYAKGKIKFGICEGPKEQCVIVRRDIEIPLQIIFAD